MFEPLGSLLRASTDAALQAGHHGQMGGHWGNGMMGGGVVWLALLFVLGAGVVVGLVLVVARQTSTREPQQSSQNAVATLRERYARGDIDDEEFETRLAKLERH
jgi:putative membrane protein